MINQVLFEHETPAFDAVQQGLFEWFGVDAEPALKYHGLLN